jgi:CRISPR-associated protein Cmr2
MPTYTAVTFAPVQGFIEKSRKLRDLYGSSFILSFLAKTICIYAETEKGMKVIVPALIDFTKGTPNNIYLAGKIDESEVRAVFDMAWRALVNTCREYIERSIGSSADRALPWKREWDLWATHAWEVFVVCGEAGETLDDVRVLMNARKQARDWVGINWRGESSTLAGADAIAYPGMTQYRPKSSPNVDAQIRDFYSLLSDRMPESSIDPRERLSIPELIKRLVTYPQVRKRVDDLRSAQTTTNTITDSSIDNQNRLSIGNIFKKLIPTVQASTKVAVPIGGHKYLASIEHLPPFSEIDRQESSRWTGWFQGDGDRLGVYISDLVKHTQPIANSDDILNQFSRSMLEWGENLQSETNKKLHQQKPNFVPFNGRVVYAGGDDFFGILYRNPPNGDEKYTGSPLTGRECMEHWWYHFDEIWNQCGKDISVSTGFVWAAPRVPQRDLLQHLRDTEKLAKTEGRDRLAIRILFNSGNYLDWSCPWRFLEKLFSSYRDRDGKNQNWTHFYRDIAALESRHAFRDDESSIASAIFDIYFPNFDRDDDKDWWNSPSSTSAYQRLQGGLLGNRPDLHPAQEHQRRNHWIINLAKVGFHLF